MVKAATRNSNFHSLVSKQWEKFRCLNVHISIPKPPLRGKGFVLCGAFGADDVEVEEFVEKVWHLVIQDKCLMSVADPILYILHI